MKILTMDRDTGHSGRDPIVARFTVELNEDVRLGALRLVRTADGMRIHYPNITGGGRAATFSKSFSEQLTAAAVAAFEGLQIAKRSAA